MPKTNFETADGLSMRLESFRAVESLTLKFSF